MTGRRAGAFLGAAVAVLLAAGCSRSVSVAGTLDDDDAVEAVWHYGGEARAAVRDGRFELAGLSGDTIDLRFTSDNGVHARMEISGLDGGARLDLRGVWLEDGVAHASGVGLEGADRVTINGIRMAPAGSLPGELDERGVVLARGSSGDALLVRPLDDGLPDLRVVVTPATEVVSPDGDPVSSGGAEVGDTVRVEGPTDSGYVVASRLELPRISATRDGGDGDGDDANGGDGNGEDGDRGDGDGGDGRGRDGEAKDDRERGRGNEGRGRGQGRGRGRGGDGG